MSKFVFKFITVLSFFSCLLSCNSKHSTLVSETESTSLFAENEKPRQLATGFSFTEGPASDAQGNVYFTDQPNDKIYFWNTKSGSVSLFSDSTHRSNGLYIDHENRLLACADLKGEIIEFSSNGKSFTSITSSLNAGRFNGPNDLWVNASGGIFFTDPNYPRPYWESPGSLAFINTMSLYYLTPQSDSAQLIDSNFKKPNGIIGSETLHKLYVTDADGNRTYVYELSNGSELSDRKLFCELGSDGMTLDERGNLYLTGNGVTVFNPQGEKIAHIPIDEHWTSNVTFSGSNNDLLFITASTSIYAMKMQVKGAK
jgi:gluconolactonase